ncbi:aminotransferase class V-fold PLP-dependent enzyme [Paenibacillus piri]|nr:aminotransferase class V-fold PLP-dependent enzyme [Paenibacillus piri]
MNPFEAVQLPRVINAAGKMTYLGSSAVLPEVAAAMSAAAQSYVDMAGLKQTVQRRVAELTGAEGACITSCAAAGIVVSVAAVLTGTDMDKVEALPEIKGTRREVILQKGHAVSFGANLTQMIRMTGAAVKEIGTVNGVKPYHLEGAITEATAAIVYVVSHHAVSNEMLTLAEVVETAGTYGIPVIVDAAAEVDLRQYLAQGADLAVYSGHKAIGGPTSGLVIGRKELIDACMLQEKGYARAMKIGKENIMGFYAALQCYLKEDPEETAGRLTEIVETLQKDIEHCGLTGISTKIVKDATRPIPRLQLIVGETAPLEAKQLIAGMERNNPSIRTRNHSADAGMIQFDPRELKIEETAVVAQVLKQLLEG